MTVKCFNQCDQAQQFCPASDAAERTALDAARFKKLLEAGSKPSTQVDVMTRDFESMSPETRTETLRELLFGLGG